MILRKKIHIQNNYLILGFKYQDISLHNILKYQSIFMTFLYYFPQFFILFLLQVYFYNILLLILKYLVYICKLQMLIYFLNSPLILK